MWKWKIANWNIFQDWVREGARFLPVAWPACSETWWPVAESQASSSGGPRTGSAADLLNQQRPPPGQAAHLSCLPVNITVPTDYSIKITRVLSISKHGSWTLYCPTYITLLKNEVQARACLARTKGVGVCFTSIDSFPLGNDRLHKISLSNNCVAS